MSVIKIILINGRQPLLILSEQRFRILYFFGAPFSATGDQSWNKNLTIGYKVTYDLTPNNNLAPGFGRIWWGGMVNSDTRTTC
jgi:hypothetical protein